MCFRVQENWRASTSRKAKWRLNQLSIHCKEFLLLQKGSFQRTRRGCKELEFLKRSQSPLLGFKPCHCAKTIPRYGQRTHWSMCTFTLKISTNADCWRQSPWASTGKNLKTKVCWNPLPWSDNWRWGKISWKPPPNWQNKGSILGMYWPRK